MTLRLRIKTNRLSEAKHFHRLQPRGFFRGFICFYMECYAIPMLLSKFPSQYRHKQNLRRPLDPGLSEIDIGLGIRCAYII